MPLSASLDNKRCSVPSPLERKAHVKPTCVLLVEWLRTEQDETRSWEEVYQFCCSFWEGKAEVLGMSQESDRVRRAQPF